MPRQLILAIQGPFIEKKQHSFWIEVFNKHAKDYLFIFSFNFFFFCIKTICVNIEDSIRTIKIGIHFPDPNGNKF
jgi:hypothetical protein